MRRPRLTNALDETTAQTIVLNAPAGYGKTTLAQEWLQGRDGVVWYRATPASADLAAFSTGLADVVSPLVHGAGERLRQRLRVGDPPERAVRPLAELMADDLRDWANDGLIVVDDYHLVSESTAVEEFVDWILTLVPVRMLVTTRRRPAWASARRFLYGETVEIGPEQLAMTDEEASHVLGSRPSEAVHALVRQAQGWPALIGLAALSASLELPEERVSDALFRYFAEEVLRQEPPEVQRFMLLASIPATINARIAREVLGFEEPEPLIEHLRNADILHPTMSDEFAFHPLLRDFLSRRLRTDDPGSFEAAARILVDRASASGDWQSAFGFASKLDDSVLQARLLGQAAPDLFMEGRTETLEKWLESCAAAVDGIPGAVIARAQLLLQQGLLSEAARIAQDVAESLPESDPDASRAWSVAGRAFHLISDDSSAHACYLRAKNGARTPNATREALWGLFLAANEIDPRSSEQYLDELERQPARDIDTRLRLAVGRQAVAEQKTTLAGLWPRYEGLVRLTSQARDPMVRSSFLANSAAVNVGRGHYDLAHSLATAALAACTEVRLDFALGVCLSFRAAAEIGLRRFGQAMRTLAQFRASSVRREDPHFQVAELTLRAKLALARSQPEAALDTLHELRFIQAPRRALGEHLGLVAIAQALVGDHPASQHSGYQAQQAVTSVEAVFYSRYADMISSIRASPPRQYEDLLAELDALIVATAEAEFFDGLVVAYRAAPDLLEFVKTSNHRGLVLSVMQRSRDHDLARTLGGNLIRSASASPIFAELTARESEVLQLMCEGLSNVDIARRLFITEGTTKVHVHRILKKLGVRTRLQAVVRANAAADEETTGWPLQPPGPVDASEPR